MGGGVTPQQTADLHDVCRLLWEAFCDDDPGIRTLARQLGVGPKGDRPTIRARKITAREVQWLEGRPPERKVPVPKEAWASTAVVYLQRRPGRWAATRIAPTKSEACHHARALRRHGAEATTRREERGWVVYASWPKAA